jgi:ABC-type lipoprotein export system ATPase subunit
MMPSNPPRETELQQMSARTVYTVDEMDIQGSSEVTHPSNNKKIITLSNVHKTYLLGIEGIPALRGVTLDVKKGEFVIVYGTSGGGKTSLLNLVGTIDQPTKGGLTLFDTRIDRKTKERDLADLRMFRMGFVFQTFNLIASMTALENVELPMILRVSFVFSFPKKCIHHASFRISFLFRSGCDCCYCNFIYFFCQLSDFILSPPPLAIEERFLDFAHATIFCWCFFSLSFFFDAQGDITKTERTKRAKEMLERVGVASRMNHMPSQLSGGEQQRVTIARALVNCPDLLLLDEPTGDLDTRNTDVIMNLLLRLNEEGITMVMVTHDDSLKHCAHRIVYMFDGKISRIKQVSQEVNCSFLIVSYFK